LTGAAPIDDLAGPVAFPGEVIQRVHE